MPALLGRTPASKGDGRMTVMLPARIQFAVAERVRTLAANEKRSIASVVGEAIERGLKEESKA